MASTLAEDRLYADTHGHNTSANLNRRRRNLAKLLQPVAEHDSLAGDSIQRAAARQLNSLDDVDAYLDSDVNNTLSARLTGWTAAIEDPVRGPDGLLCDPAVVITFAGDPSLRVAAIALTDRARAGSVHRFTLPDPGRIAELVSFGVAARDARAATVVAADAWALTLRVSAELASVARCDEPGTCGEDLLAAWVHHTELDHRVRLGRDELVERVLVRYPPGGGTNLDYDEFADHAPYEPFAIWDPGNATLHIAHSGPDPAADDAEPVIVASVDNQAAEHPASAQAVAEAAISTLRAQLDDRDERIAVLYDPTAPLGGLRCDLCEPDVALIDAAMRPPRTASLGLVESSSRDRRSGLDWAEDVPDRTRSRLSPALSL